MSSAFLSVIAVLKGPDWRGLSCFSPRCLQGALPTRPSASVSRASYYRLVRTSAQAGGDPGIRSLASATLAASGHSHHGLQQMLQTRDFSSCPQSQVTCTLPLSPASAFSLSPCRREWGPSALPLVSLLRVLSPPHPRWLLQGGAQSGGSEEGGATRLPHPVSLHTVLGRPPSRSLA